MTAKEYELTSTIYDRLKAQGFELVCRKCQKPLEVGDTVVSRKTRESRTIRYHKKCYNDLFYGNEVSQIARKENRSKR